MQVFAHRGFHRDVPENTLAAFDAAWSARIPGIETDIRLDRDGVAILFHDRAVAGRLVSSLTLAELRETTRIEVPTLDAALGEIGNIFWNLEIKETAAVAETIRLIKAHGRGLDTVVSSFIHAAVVDVCAATGVPGGLLISHRPVNPLTVLDGMPQGISTVIWNHATADADSLRRVRETGKSNWVYGFATPEDHADIDPRYVSSVITDFPTERNSWSAG